ncbi:MAG: acetylserotonin O-methyltransferase [Nitratireductor sp.]|nr:acetylserotonin O-methyltransferase [Nitratireductor sp.]
MSLDERLRRWRNGLVGSAGFQEFANRFWPLRIIARRRARDLFSTVSGFIHSQILHACVESGLFELLKSGPRTDREIARHTGIPEAQLSRLLEPAMALKLVSRDRQGRWWLADAGAVVAGNPGIVAMIRHHAMLYRDLADPLKLLRDADSPTETQAYWSYVRGPDVDPATAAQYSALMTASQDMLIAEVLAAVSFGRDKTLLDIGGGEGAFLTAAGERHPQLNLWLFDLPSVPAPGGRISKFAGDFFETPLPAGADTITLLRVVCDHEDDQVVRLLRNVRQALAPGGRLVIGEPMAGAGGEASLAAAYFGFYFLAMRSGRCRTPQHIAGLLEKAGFSRSRFIATRAPLSAAVIEASP